MYIKGQKLFVDFLKESCCLKHYLVSCGFINGAVIEVLAVSPLKKTLLLSVAGSVISLKTSVLGGVEWKK